MGAVSADTGALSYTGAMYDRTFPSAHVRMSSSVLLGGLLLLTAGCAKQQSFRAPAVTTSTSNSASGGDSYGLGTAKYASGKPASEGRASWYGEKFAGKKTANGELFDPKAMTAAHRKLPFGTWVEVRRKDSGATVRVRINDRGPWGDDSKVIDVSYAAAERLGMIFDGVVPVEVWVVSGP